MTRIYLKEKEMKKTLGILLAAGSLWANIGMAANPPEVRVAYSGGSQVLMLAKADGSLDKALHSQVKWVQFASGADALNYFASNAIDIANFGSSPATAGIVRKLPVEIIGVSGVIASYERLIGKDGINTIKDIEGNAWPIRQILRRLMRWKRRLASINWIAAKSPCCHCARQRWLQPGNAATLMRVTSGRRLRRSWNPPAVTRSSPPKICRKMAT
jgi:hypothetical protein